MIGHLPLSADRTAPETHQHQIDRHTMQPSGEAAFALERPDLAHKVKENFLRQVFGIRGISCHAQAY